jgi:exosortase
MIPAAITVIALAYAPMLWAFFGQQWSRPQSQFFPFVLAAFGGMLWSRWRQAPAVLADEVPPVWPAAMLGGLAWLSLVLAIAMYNPWLSAVSAILAVGAVCVHLSLRRRVTYLWGLWATLWLIVPLPLGWDQQLVFQLQLLSSRLSSQVLDVLGVSHLMSGNQLILPDKQLFVDEACSGIVSVMSIVACAVIYGVWRNRPPLFILALAAGGVFWAVIMNTLRISAIAAVHTWWGVDWSAGMPHETLSLVIFLATFGALLSTEQLLAGLLAAVETPWVVRTGHEMRYGQWLARAWDWANSFWEPDEGATEPVPVAPSPRLATPSSPRAMRTFARAFFPAAFAFGLLAAGQIGLMAWAGANPAIAVAGVQRAANLAENSLPATLGGLQRTKFEIARREQDDIFGEFSRSYVYSDAGGAPHLVSCDFPFSQGWHELTICYTGAGWRVTKRSTKSAPSDAVGGAWRYVEAELERDDGAQGYVVWSMFDEAGEPVSPPLGALRDQIWRLFVRRSPYVPTTQMFQTQVFISDPERISDERKQTARELLAAAREELREKIVHADKPTRASEN